MSPALPSLTSLSRALMLALCLWGGAAGAQQTPSMADAMSRMMEAMGVFGSAAGTTNPPVGGSSMQQAGEVGRRMMDGVGKGASGGALDGLWEAAGGGLLIVQGGNYRLYAPDGGYVDGSIQVVGSGVRLANRRVGFDLAFEYALDQGRLAMRDARGQVYLYRRLVLDGGG
ncbi:hypothetical protein [uncultured Thiodictyon sp.]|uniref:hypothetical protein n=1 Tax=uncultured Thiodictyon sp. TaxID=1846217 RepID=UPI0025DF5E7D|nr:hypothetical protein [uncultured Thiodictyon sp.]